MNHPRFPVSPFRSAGLGRLRRLGLALAIGLLPALPAPAQVSLQLNIQGAGFGVELRSFPSLVLVPGYPVYYAPQLRSNYFFYDGMYWVFAEDTWYGSRWYNGPWGRVSDDLVPLYLLRVPVRYYRQPPVYFRGWRADAPPRWNEHWGNDWAARRPDWDRWDRRNVPRAAPLPLYQRSYAGPRYPREPERQEMIRTEQERRRPSPAPTAMPAPPRPAPQAVQQPMPHQVPQAPAPSPPKRRPTPEGGPTLIETPMPPQHTQRPQQPQRAPQPQQEPHAPAAAPPARVAPPPQRAPAVQPAPAPAHEARPAPPGRGGDKRGEKDDNRGDNRGGDQRPEQGGGRRNGERP